MLSIQRWSQDAVIRVSLINTYVACLTRPQANVKTRMCGFRGSYIMRTTSTGHSDCYRQGTNEGKKLNKRETSNASVHQGSLNALVSLKIMWIKCFGLSNHQISTQFQNWKILDQRVRQCSPPPSPWHQVIKHKLHLQMSLWCFWCYMSFCPVWLCVCFLLSAGLRSVLISMRWPDKIKVVYINEGISCYCRLCKGAWIGCWVFL